MKKEVNVYIRTENDKHDLVFKRNGKVNLTKAPAGYRFVPFPVDTMENAQNLDPRFIMPHKFSLTEHLSFFVLVKDTDPSPLQLYKTDAARDERYNKRFIEFSAMSTEDDSGEVIPYDAPSDYNLEDTVVRSVTHDEIRAKLHLWDEKNRKYNQQHPDAMQRTVRYEDIYVVCYIWRDTVTEASEDLGMPMTTISDAIRKINPLVREYYEE